MSSNSINSNTVFNTVKSVFSIIYPLITFPYIARVLMTDSVGIISFGNSIVSYFSLIASLGVSTYAIRECSKVKEDKKALEKTASQIYSINVVSTLFAYVCLVVVLFFAKPLENYRLLICILSLTIFFATIGADWLNTAMEDFRFIAIRTMFFQVVSFATILFFVHKPEDYITYAIISVIASSGANIVNVFYRKKYCRIAFTLQMDVKKHLPKILFMFSLILSQIVYVNSDMTILGLLKGDHEVGLYSISVKMYRIINTTIASIAFVVMPKLSYYFMRKEYNEINKLLKYSLNFIIVLGIPSICGLEVLAPHLISVVAGEAYLDATLSLRLLGCALFCSFIGGWVGNITFLPAGREKVILKISIISALVNIFLNILLIPRWGLNAAAFTTFVSELLCMACGLALLDKNIKIEGLKLMLLGPVAGSIGIVFIGFFFMNICKVSWLIVVLTIMASMIWYFLVLLLTKNDFFVGFLYPVFNRIKRRL